MRVNYSTDRKIVDDRPITILKSSMSDGEVQIALAPRIDSGAIIVPKIRGEKGDCPFLDHDVILERSDLTVVAYFNGFNFITMGVLWNTQPVAWNDLPDQIRLRVRDAAKRRNIPLETLQYWDEGYYILEALS